MKRLRKLLIVSAIIFTLAIISYTLIQAAYDNSENNTAISKYTTTESQNETAKKLVVHQNPSIKTQQDISQLNSTGITLDDPSNTPTISQDNAINLASQYAEGYASTAKNIVAEYKLMTNTQFMGFSDSARDKNSKLKADGFLNKTPVYIVSFKGINKPAHSSFFNKDATIFHEYNVVVDANSGEILYAFSYR